MGRYERQLLEFTADEQERIRNATIGIVGCGVAISVVSVVMGHLSTRTTEQHYAGVKNAVAVKEVAKTFEHMEDAPPEYNDSQRVR